MNEVEKMYENAGVDFGYNNFGVPNIHPPFTAEKQLRLMAFLINRKVELSFKVEQGEITVEAISRGLAGIVNRIWQDITEEECKQIKEILE